MKDIISRTKRLSDQAADKINELKYSQASEKASQDIQSTNLNNLSPNEGIIEGMKYCVEYINPVELNKKSGLTSTIPRVVIRFIAPREL